MNQWQFAVTPWLVAAFIIVGGLAAYFFMAHLDSERAVSKEYWAWRLSGG